MQFVSNNTDPLQKVLHKPWSGWRKINDRHHNAHGEGPAPFLRRGVWGFFCFGFFALAKRQRDLFLRQGAPSGRGEGLLII